MMSRDPSWWRGILCCMEYVHKWHIIIQDYDFSLLSMLIYLYISVTLFAILNLVQMFPLVIMCSIYNNIIGLVTKGYHGCKCCVTSIKVMWSQHLQKSMYYYLRVFLPEDHPYRRVSSTFNVKPKITWRPQIMTPIDWLRAYEIEKEKEIA